MKNSGKQPQLTCISIKATGSPAGARRPSCTGNRLARVTTIAVIQGRLPPLNPNALAA